MFRHNARLRKRRPSSPPVFGRGGEKPPPLPKWEGRRGGSRGSRDAQLEQARAGERAAGQRAGVERGGRRRGTGSRAPGPRGAEGRLGAGGGGRRRGTGSRAPGPRGAEGRRGAGGAPEGDRVPRPRPARGRGPGGAGGGRRRGTGSRAIGPRGAEGRRGAGGGRRRGTGSRAPGPRGAEGRRGAGGHFIGEPERRCFPLPSLFCRPARGVPLSPARGPRGGVPLRAGQMPESGDESQGITVKGLLCPLRYPGSDLGRLRMIWRPHAELECCRVGPRRAQSSRARGPCPVAR